MRLLRVRDLDRPPPPDRHLPARPDRPTSAAPSTTACRRRRASSSAAARPRSSRRPTLAEVLRAIPVAGGAEITVECNPDDVTVELLTEYAAAGVNRVSIGVQSMVGHVLGSLGRTPRPAQRRDGGGGSPDGGLPTFNLDVIYGAAGESLADWRTTVESILGSRPAARVGVRPDDRGRHAARRPARPASRRRRPGRQVRARRRRCSPPPGSRTTRSRTGPAAGTSAGTTSCTGASRTTPASGARPTRTGPGGGGGTCARPTATSSSSTQRLPTEASGETLDDETRRIEGLQLALRMRDGVPARRARRRRARRPGRPGRRPLGAHPLRPPARQRDLARAST